MLQLLVFNPQLVLRDGLKFLLLVVLLSERTIRISWQHMNDQDNKKHQANDIALLLQQQQTLGNDNAMDSQLRTNEDNCVPILIIGKVIKYVFGAIRDVVGV